MQEVRHDLNGLVLFGIKYLCLLVPQAGMTHLFRLRKFYFQSDILKIL